MANMARNSSFWLALGGVSTFTSLYLARGLALDGLNSLTRPGGIWRILAIIFALLNLKTLPFGWHIRLLRGLLSHVSLSRGYSPPSPGPRALFQPVITSTRPGLGEIDYNGHQSNSAYFANLDVSRMHHICCLMKHGLHKAHYFPERNTDGSKKGRLGVMLGGVTCSFKKEIKPFEAYEIWTRVLAWDKKWLYLLSHIVKKGAVIPKGYTLQPEKKMTRMKRSSGPRPTSHTKEHGPGGVAEGPNPAIFATSIAKYVFKEGRITIPPEIALEASELLPKRPQDHAPSSRTKSSTEEPSAIDDTGVYDICTAEPGSKLEGKTVELDDAWDWARVENERARGMEIAQHMADLDQLHWEFTGDKTPALGRY